MFLSYCSIHVSNWHMENNCHVLEVPSTSNEKPGILINIPSISKYFDQKPRISIEILGISNQKFWNTRFFAL